MKRILPFLLAALLILTGCEYTENWSQDVLLSTEEPLSDSVTRITPEPSAVQTEDPSPAATSVPSVSPDAEASDPQVIISDGETTVYSTALGFVMSISNPVWTCDPSWDRERGLPTEFVFFHKTPETGGNLIGVITYTYDGDDMETTMNDKIAAVMDGIDDYTREDISVGDVTAVRTVQSLDDGLYNYLATNVFWIEGNRIIRITAAAEADDKDEVWDVTEQLIKSYRYYEG